MPLPFSIDPDEQVAIQAARAALTVLMRNKEIEFLGGRGRCVLISPSAAALAEALAQDPWMIFSLEHPRIRKKRT